MGRLKVPFGRGRLRLFQQASTEVKLRVVLERGLSGPPLTLRADCGDMTFVLKVKVECALRLLRDAGGGADAAGPAATAEDVELEFRGVPMRDMMAIDKYGVEDGSELVAYYAPKPPEKDVVVRAAGYDHLDALLTAERGVPSTGTLRRVIAKRGRLCQVCWRRRWFRAEVLNVYSTSLLLGWLDWPDAEWPHFFVRVALASAPGAEPGDGDETWRGPYRDPTHDLAAACCLLSQPRAPAHACCGFGPRMGSALARDHAGSRAANGAAQVWRAAAALVGQELPPHLRLDRRPARE